MNDAHLLWVGVFDRRMQRNLFLQEQLDAFDARVGVEAADERLVHQVVVQGQQHHALVVGHVGAHDRIFLPGGQPASGEIYRFIQPISAAGIQLLQPLDVLHHCPGRVRQGQNAGIRRDHQVISQAALVTQPRHPKSAVLVRLRRIEVIITGFRDPPGSVLLLTIGNLMLDRRPAALFHQRVGIAFHQ